MKPGEAPLGNRRGRGRGDDVLKGVAGTKGGDSRAGEHGGPAYGLRVRCLQPRVGRRLLR